MDINWGDLYWVVETILKAVGAPVRLREKGQMGLGLKTRNRVAGLDFACAVKNGAWNQIPRLVGYLGPDEWVAGGAHSIIACRMGWVVLTWVLVLPLFFLIYRKFQMELIRAVPFDGLMQCL